MSSRRGAPTMRGICRSLSFISLFILIASSGYSQQNSETSEILFFREPSLSEWKIEGEDIWGLNSVTVVSQSGVETKALFLSSQIRGEEKTGKLTSPVFTIESPFQKFLIAGADGTATGQNDGRTSFLYLKSHPDGEVLREMRPPGTHVLTPANWNTADLMGRKVYLEIIDGDPKIRPDGFAWIGLADYRQVTPEYKDPIKTDDLWGITTKADDEIVCCRSLPFLLG